MLLVVVSRCLLSLPSFRPFIDAQTKSKIFFLSGFVLFCCLSPCPVCCCSLSYSLVTSVSVPFIDCSDSKDGSNNDQLMKDLIGDNWKVLVCAASWLALITLVHS